MIPKIKITGHQASGWPLIPLASVLPLGCSWVPLWVWGPHPATQVFPCSSSPPPEAAWEHWLQDRVSASFQSSHRDQVFQNMFFFSKSTLFSFQPHAYMFSQETFDAAQWQSARHTLSIHQRDCSLTTKPDISHMSICT